MANLLKIAKTDIDIFVSATLISLLAFLAILAHYAIAETESLSVVVATSATMTVTTQNFSGNLNPGTPKYATSTIDVQTNTTNGWYVELYGQDRATGNTTMDLSTDASIGLTDATEWIPASATTSAGNAAQITSGDDVLAFRVMMATGTQKFRATSWWGTADGYPGGASSLWAGFASSTASNLKIGQISSGDYTSTSVLNDVLYYLDVPPSQQTGTYEGNLIYTLVTP
jgi:hypothetical protein